MPKVAFLDADPMVRGVDFSVLACFNGITNVLSKLPYSIVEMRKKEQRRLTQPARLPPRIARRPLLTHFRDRLGQLRHQLTDLPRHALLQLGRGVLLERRIHLLQFPKLPLLLWPVPRHRAVVTQLAFT